MNSTDPATAVDAWVAALNAHDPDAVAAVFAPDAVFMNVGAGQRHEGRDAIRADHENLFGMWSDLTVQKMPYLVDGDRWAGEWTMSGVHTGDTPGLPATGKSFTISGGGFGQVRDGKVVRTTQYWNMAEFLTQVGLMPAPEG
jgi:steroid delta-isomerase-like uncharacterized protein